MSAGYDLGAFQSSSEELGGELNPNSTFSNFTGDIPDGWTVVGDDDAGNNISQGSAGGLRIQSDGSAIYAQLADITTSGKIYKYSITLENLTDDDFNFNNGGTTFFTANGKSEGTYTGHFEAVSTFIRIIRLGSCDGEVTAFSIKEVLQSEVSDTHPAIIDVNEPVLGVDLSPDSDFTLSGTQGASTAGTYWTTGVNTTIADGKVTKTGGGSATLFTTNEIVTQGKLYQATIVIDEIDENTVNVIFSGTGSSKRVGGVGTHKVNGIVNDTNERVFLGLDYHLDCVISSFSIKQIQGNVGTMTNQDSADLVYSSVLPDQSFLTGVNSAYNFIDLDGSNEYIDTGNPFESLFKESFTLSAWIKIDDGQPSAINSIINTRNGFAGYIYFQVETNGKIKFVHGANLEKELSITTDNVIFSDGASDWTHVAGVFSKSSNTSGSVTIYVNGQSAGSSSSPASSWNTDNYSNSAYNVVIGARNSLGSIDRFFSGDIGQTAFYNKELSSTEVSAIYTLGRHGNLLDSYSDNLKGYWAMGALDAKTGLSDVGNGTIYDRSGNSNHGTATNTESADLKSSPNAEPNGYAKGDTNRSTTTP